MAFEDEGRLIRVRGTGKTTLAMLYALAEIQRGGHVLYYSRVPLAKERFVEVARHFQFADSTVGRIKSGTPMESTKHLLVIDGGVPVANMLKMDWTLVVMDGFNIQPQVILDNTPKTCRILYIWE